MIEFDADLARGDFKLSVRFESRDPITAVFGPSGCGKTTILRLIAGLERPDRGRIAIRGRALVDTEQGIFVRRHRRRVGFVFQDSQLFPHLTVAHNIRFGRWFAPTGSDAMAIEPVVAALGLADLMGRRTPALSGGEKQRVALARALLAGPELLLMDEPLASLDDARKAEIIPLIARIQAEFDIPIIYVTHAVSEVMALASRVVVLEAGRVTMVGSREDFERRLRDGTPCADRDASPLRAGASQKP
jgi:molybdate transport system ATP-binding protein